jgi:beta-aspartyl-dipeptidase (metallo-type)
MLTLIQNGEILSPDPLGVQPILLAADKIMRIGGMDRDDMDSESLRKLDPDLNVIDARGCMVVPGIIDPHQHLIGAGGESGFRSRMPEISIEQELAAGITTAVGILGTDTTTRHLTSLLAKARQLEEQGITTYMYTGGFQIPVPTMTGSVHNDIVIIDKVIGVGEIAISDVRSVEPTPDELARVVSEALIGGELTSKAGVVHFHVGEGKRRLSLLHTMLDNYDVPAECLYPTHVTRTRELLDDAIALSKRGVYVDTDVVEENLGECLRYYRDNGGVMEQFTASSDAHTAGGTPAKLYGQLVSCVQQHGFTLREVLPHFTSNTAKALRLAHKGQLKVGHDADMLILDRDTLEIRHVIAKGWHGYCDGKMVE